MVRKNADIPSQPAPQTAAKPAAAGANSIAAVLPGTITRIYKKPGEAVAYGEPVAVYQTGDVELEIAATVAGTIKTIDVAAGTAVTAGSLIATLS